jgi:hypothetical protein
MKYKKVYNLSQLKKNMSHIHLPVHTIIWLVLAVSWSFKLSAVSLKKSCGTLKFLIFMQWYASKKVQEWLCLSAGVLVFDA